MEIEIVEMDSAAALRSADEGTPFRAGDFSSDRGTQESLSMVKQLTRLGALRVVGGTAHA